MKSGTTSLWRYLAAQPELFLPDMKEPAFFSSEERWARGVRWYRDLFGDADPGQIAGEASVGYTSPWGGDRAARRIHRLLPGVKLVYLLRHPIDRLRSHYRHEVQRGRERRPLDEALRGVDNPYLGFSLYRTRLAPYVQRFPPHQLLLLRFEDLFHPDGWGWNALLGHLGLSLRPMPALVANATESKRRYTPAMRRLFERRLLPRTTLLPTPIRRVGRWALTRNDAHYRWLLEASRGPVPGVVADAVWRDVEGLQELGFPAHLWERAPNPQP